MKRSNMVNLVISIYEDYEIHEIGFDIFEFCQKADINLVPYSKFSDSERKLLETKSDDAFGSLNYKTNRFQIFYNDDVLVSERIIFTIAHELGHYFLGHYTTRTYISSRFREQEANNFATVFYTPLIILLEYGITSEKDIREKLKISLNYAEATAERLMRRRLVNDWSDEERRLLEIFKKNKEKYEKQSD